MATPEGRVKRWLDTMLKAEEVWYFSPQAGPYGSAGIPDRIAIICGLFVGIEVKADEKCKMTALQERCAKAIRNVGGFHFLVYDKETIEEVRQWIKNVRACNSGQEGIGIVHGRSCQCASLYPDSTASKGQPCFNPPPTGRDEGLTEPGILHPLSNSVLLYLAGASSAHGSPENNGSLPNHA